MARHGGVFGEESVGATTRIAKPWIWSESLGMIVGTTLCSALTQTSFQSVPVGLVER